MAGVNGVELELWEARCAFTNALAQLLVWADMDPVMLGFEVALGEGLVAVTDAADGDYDGPHMQGGAHYTGLGHDILVYTRGGAYVADGFHAAYATLGAKWRTLHALARWGGDFPTPDPDHFSFAWKGKS